RVAARGVARALLVADQHVAQALRIHERVVGGQDRTAGEAEDDLCPGVLEGLDQRLCASHLLSGPRNSFVVSDRAGRGTLTPQSPAVRWGTKKPLRLGLGEGRG